MVIPLLIHWECYSNVHVWNNRISYCPKSVGKYAIHVLDSEQNTAGKPIKVDVFDPNMIKLSKIGDAVLGQDNRIRVDTGMWLNNVSISN